MVEAQFAPRFTLTSKRFIAPPLQISYRSYTSFVSQSQVEWKQGSSGLAMERTLLFFVHGRALHSATMCKDSLDAAQEARALMVELGVWLLNAFNNYSPPYQTSWQVLWLPAVPVGARQGAGSHSTASSSLKFWRSPLYKELSNSSLTDLHSHLHRFQESDHADLDALLTSEDALDRLVDRLALEEKSGETVLNEELLDKAAKDRSLVIHLFAPVGLVRGPRPSNPYRALPLEWTTTGPDPTQDELLLAHRRWPQLQWRPDRFLYQPLPPPSVQAVPAEDRRPASKWIRRIVRYHTQPLLLMAAPADPPRPQPTSVAAPTPQPIVSPLLGSSSRPTPQSVPASNARSEPSSTGTHEEGKPQGEDPEPKSAALFRRASATTFERLVERDLHPSRGKSHSPEREEADPDRLRTPLPKEVHRQSCLVQKRTPPKEATKQAPKEEAPTPSVPQPLQPAPPLELSLPPLDPNTPDSAKTSLSRLYDFLLHGATPALTALPAVLCGTLTTLPNEVALYAVTSLMTSARVLHERYRLELRKQDAALAPLRLREHVLQLLLRCELASRKPKARPASAEEFLSPISTDLKLTPLDRRTALDVLLDDLALSYGSRCTSYIRALLDEMWLPIPAAMISVGDIEAEIALELGLRERLEEELRREEEEEEEEEKSTDEMDADEDDLVSFDPDMLGNEMGGAEGGSREDEEDEEPDSSSSSSSLSEATVPVHLDRPRLTANPFARANGVSLPQQPFHLQPAPAPAPPSPALKKIKLPSSARGGRFFKSDAVETLTVAFRPKKQRQEPEKPKLHERILARTSSGLQANPLLSPLPANVTPLRLTAPPPSPAPSNQFDSIPFSPSNFSTARTARLTPASPPLVLSSSDSSQPLPLQPLQLTSADSKKRPREGETPEEAPPSEVKRKRTTIKF